MKKITVARHAGDILPPKVARLRVMYADAAVMESYADATGVDRTWRRRLTWPRVTSTVDHSPYCM